MSTRGKNSDDFQGLRKCFICVNANAKYNPCLAYCVDLVSTALKSQRTAYTRDCMMIIHRID